MDCLCLLDVRPVVHLAARHSPFILFVLWAAMLIAAYNVFWFIEDETKANRVSWAIINTSYLILPLSFYYVGKRLNEGKWCFVASIVFSFAVSNMLDFLGGRQYQLYLPEYLFAALSSLLVIYQYRKGKWKT